MPYRKTPLVNNHYYHIYNRGVEKRLIFESLSDYQTFTQILRWYLREDLEKPILSKIPKKSLKSYVDLLSYCLMPNHFHLLLLQNKDDGITNFVRTISTAYAMYFNRKANRIGSLFQGRFQAKLIETDEQLLQVSKYIHRNPLPILERPGLSHHSWSSYPTYLNRIQNPMINKTIVLSYFSKNHPKEDYRTFVEEIDTNLTLIENLIFEKK